MDLDKLLGFFRIMTSFQQVQRALYGHGENRKENDVEHSYQLAMVAWYIISLKKLSLNLDKVLRYALVHDFVEVYAGDTYFYGDRSGKEEREKAAHERLKSEFPELVDFHSVIDLYEKRADPESVFVYALDKLLPVVNIYLDNGRTWKEYGITRDMLIGNKKEKISISPEVYAFFEELIVRLQREEPQLFAQAK